VRSPNVGFLVHALTREWRGKSSRTGVAEQMRWRREGDAARDAKNWMAATHAYERHLDLMPNDTAIWVQYGHALKEVGNLPRALAAYEQGMRLSPNDKDLATHLYHLRRRVSDRGGLTAGGSDGQPALPGDAKSGLAYKREVSIRTTRPVVTSPGVADASLVADRLGIG